MKDDRLIDDGLIVKRLNHYVYKNLLISFLISSFGYFIIYYGDFSYTFIVPVLAGVLLQAVFLINMNHLISMTSNDDSNSIELKYFNFLDKIKEEAILKQNIKTFRKSKLDNKIKIELRDNRVISLYNLKKVKRSLTL